MSAKWLGVKKVRLDSIVLPGGFAKRKKEDHVRDLADSIKRGGVISLPVIEAGSRKLVAGGDRLAALQLLKVAQHEVRLVEGTAEELEVITIEENLWRRRTDDYDGLTKRLIDLVAKNDANAQTQLYRAKHRFKGEGASAELPDRLTGNSESPGPGRPKTERGAAREEVAAKLGKTPEAIRQAEKRARQKEREAEEEKIPEEVRLSEKPPVTTFGVPLSVDDARAIQGVQVVIGAVDEALRRAQRYLSSLKDMPIGAALYRRMQSTVHEAVDIVRRERPEAVCPVCKRIPARLTGCAFCGGVGVVSNDKLAACAPELLLAGDKAVVPDGRGGFVPYAREAAPAKAAGNPAKKLQVTGHEGNPFPVDDVPARDLSDEDIPF